MGACFDSALIADPEFKLTEKELDAKANDIYEQSAYEHGHGGYSGTLAEHTGQGVILNKDKVFDDKEDAWSWIDDNHDDKWDTPMAVPVRGVGWAIGCWCSS
jgi:hypothetical protein